MILYSYRCPIQLYQGDLAMQSPSNLLMLSEKYAAEKRACNRPAIICQRATTASFIQNQRQKIPPILIESPFNKDR